MPPSVNDRAREAVLRRFRWVHGHADIWRIFADAEAFRLVTAALALPVRDANVTKVCAVESRGFLLGGAVARELRTGFVGIRKTDGVLPGMTLESATAFDYRGRSHLLRLQREALGPTDRVLLVDDWAELGSQAIAAKDLIVRTGAKFQGLTLIVDDLDKETRAAIGCVTAIIERRELGSDAP